MAKYLIDANLPYYFGLWNNSEFIHVHDIDDTWSDEMIWEFAKENNLTIVTKDADFSLKAFTKGIPPKVIHIKFGNLKMNEFHDLILKIWKTIDSEIEKCSLINVYYDKIEIIK